MDFAYENNCFKKGLNTVAGIDEAGRGPLAGPVVAACVVFGSGFQIPAVLAPVKDSKKLSAKKRAELYGLIGESCLELGIGICGHKTVDRINILQATFLAMKKAVSMIRNKPDLVLLDGRWSIPNTSLKQQAIIKGDEKIFSIAAASIVAKVARDRIMEDSHNKYPQYGFNKHKGYGTKLHLEMISKHGICEIHRQSFSPIKKTLHG